jgi:hypothetical protein
MRLCSTKCQLRDECSGNNVVAAREESKLSPPVTDIRSIDACYGESHCDIPIPPRESQHLRGGRKVLHYLLYLQWCKSTTATDGISLLS